MFVCVQFVLCAVMFVILNRSVSEELKFKVVAPEYICSKENIPRTAIRLIGEDVPNLKYNWSVDYNLENLQGLKQRHILMIWRSVRNLNAILQTVSSDDTSRGIIFLNNTMFTPGVKYVINIIAQMKENISVVERKQVALEYIEKTSTKSVLSAYLTGPEVTYADMSYTAQAEVTTCAENSKYQLAWQILDKSSKMIHEESTKSRILQLPPGSLSSGNIYFIKCLVFDDATNKNNSSPMLRINVLERGMQLSTYTKYLKVGFNQPIYLNAFFNNPDCLKGELTFEWKCTNSAKEDCAEFESGNSTELLLLEGFSEAGSYEFTVQARKGNASATATSTVEVVDEMLPVIDVENAMTSCNPSDTLRISAHVSRLVAGCNLQWICLDNITDFKFIDLNSVPGQPGKLFEITADQIDKFNNNNTLDKQFDLILPSSDDGTWKGLESDSKYVLRLIASCPSCPEENSSEKLTAVEIFSSIVDVVVKTNASPLLNILQVTPKSGDAIRTLFTFSTVQPSNCSNPLLYKFGFVKETSKNKIFIIRQYETTNAVTVLPFNEGPIQTILEVCDSKSACNSTLGPKVIVKLPNKFTVAETDSLISAFGKAMFEQDYFSAFSLSSIVLQTANKMQSNVTFNRFYGNVKNITLKEIECFLNSTGKSWVQPASNLLKYIKVLDNEIPEEILDDIIALRDKISESQSTTDKNKIKSEKLETAPTRKLLSLRTNKKSKRIVNDINIDEIKDYLEISELTIKRLTDFERVTTEKQKLRNKLAYYMPRICQFIYNNYKTNVRIVLSSILLDVEKINLMRKFNEFLFVPYDMSVAARLQIGRDTAERFRSQNGVCVGKILFLDDYFDIPQYVYDAKLYTAYSDYYLNTDLENFGVAIQMPIKSPASNDQTFQCVLWENQQWDFTKCKTVDESSERVRCLCKSIGYFSIVPVERTTTLTTTPESTFKTSATIPLLVSQVTESVPTVPNILMTNSNGQYYVTRHSSFTTTDRTANYNHDDGTFLGNETNVSSAGIWSISLLSIGIFTLFLAFLILLRKLKRSKAVQSFQVIEYAQFYHEHTLE